MASTSDTRFCGVELASPGHSPDYCRNVVMNGSPKCAAGHAVPALGSTPGAYVVTVQTSKSAAATFTTTDISGESHPTTIDFDEIESFLATTDLSSIDESTIHEPSVAEMEAAAAAAVATEDTERADEIHGLFVHYYGVRPEVMSYAGTVRGERKRLSEDGSAPFQLDRFTMQGTKTVLAFGDYGAENQIYLESDCHSKECGRHAYTRLHIIQVVAEESASESMVQSARRDALATMLSDADSRSKQALCDHHRMPADSQGL